jgi:HAD superfamily hydrolase (TIGR01509 family)
MTPDKETRFGVLWDFDGVIADTEELHYKAWAHVLAEHGIPFDRGVFLRTFGMINSEALSRWFGRPLTAEVTQSIGGRKEEIFLQEARGRVTLLPGVKTLLQRLRSADIRQAVASSAPLRNIEVLVDSLGIRPYFTALVSASDMAGKPDPAVFLVAARRIGLPPRLCVVIEDSLPGVEAARRAGMACIGVTNTHPPGALDGADLIVDTLEELPPDALRILVKKRGGTDARRKG